MIKAWIQAFRLRTLPLSLSSIGMGGFLAAASNRFDWPIFLLCCLTTIFLQILSNLANDYGDSIHGADHQDRQGPKRAVQTGAISSEQMRKAMMIFVGLSLISGIALLLMASRGNWILLGSFFALGLISIWAAINYTAGKKPYGYAGLGDISVFLFFGLVGVLGTYFLITQSFQFLYVLPAASCGLFAVAVLNINNIRDINSDKTAGKNTIPVRMGRKGAIVYHISILSLGLLASLFYVFLQYKSPWQLLFLLSLPLLALNVKGVAGNNEAMKLDPFLKQMAMTTLLFVITFGIGQIL